MSAYFLEEVGVASELFDSVLESLKYRFVKFR